MKRPKGQPDRVVTLTLTEQELRERIEAAMDRGWDMAEDMYEGPNFDDVLNEVMAALTDGTETQTP